MVVLFGHGVPGEVVNGGFTNINFAFGIGVTMGCYVAGRISGAHLNPAVTLAVAMFRGFSWVKVIPYWIAQTAGAFCASAIVYWNYRPQFHRGRSRSGSHGRSLHHVPGISATCSRPGFSIRPSARRSCCS